MKNLYFYIGRIGSGKTHFANKFAPTIKGGAYVIEVSTVMRTFAPLNATRDQLQAVKLQMKANPRFLVNEIIRQIEAAPSEHIIISGLRELWIYNELTTRYNTVGTLIVNSAPELRRARRNMSPQEFAEAEKRDDDIGVGELINTLAPIATMITNNYEWSTVAIRRA